MGRGTSAAKAASGALVVLCVAYAVEPVAVAGAAAVPRSLLLPAAVALVAFCVALGHVVLQGRVAGRPWSLVLAGIIGVGLFVQFGPALVALPALVAGTGGFLLTRVRAASVVLVTLGCVVAVLIGRGSPPLAVVELTGRAMILMVTIWAAGTVVTLAGEVERRRREGERLAVAEERLRFARDLHDLLGQSLSAISLRGEVATRLLRTDPTAAGREIDGLVGIARRALNEMRGLVDGYRTPSLTSEIDGAGSVLAAAGIEVRADPVPDGLPPDVRAVLGWVVREGITNVLRHSSANRCAITFRSDAETVVLDIVNDRPCTGEPSGASPGHGLAGLAERLLTVSGRLENGPVGAGEFRLRATVPVSGEQL